MPNRTVLLYACLHMFEYASPFPTRLWQKNWGLSKVFACSTQLIVSCMSVLFFLVSSHRQHVSSRKNDDVGNMITNLYGPIIMVMMITRIVIGLEWGGHRRAHTDVYRY